MSSARATSWVFSRWAGSSLSSSFQAVSSSTASQGPFSWGRLPPKPPAPVTARMLNSSGRNFCPRARSSSGIAGASFRSASRAAAFWSRSCSSGISPLFFLKKPNMTEMLLSG